jgi:cytochrome c
MHSHSRVLLLLALVSAATLVGLGRGGPVPEPFDEDRFEREILVPACTDPMGIDVRPDGRVLWIERGGNFKIYLPATREVLKLGTVPTAVFGEVGMLGMAADQSFDRTGWVYLFFCPTQQKETMRLSRFTVAGKKLDLASEKKLLDYKIDIAGAIHMGGGLAMDGKGNLYVGVGDNCPPIPEVPIDLRPGKEISDAFRTAGNSRDLRGKVLRIHPEPDGSYTIPKDNLWPDGKDGRPETFAMGCRNPFRLSVDPKTDWLYFGDVGPNVERETGISPEGYDEINQAPRAGNYGWPFCTGPNAPFTQYDFATKKVGPRWDLTNLVNPSQNNTGIKKLPSPIPALIWYATGPSKEFPELGSGGRSAMVGPVYYDNPALQSTVKLPVGRYDRTLFVFDWMRNWIKAVHLDDKHKIARIEPFLPKMSFRKPIDIRTGPEGALYIAEYGDKWGDNHDAQIVRIVYRRGNRPPVAIAQARPSAGKHPLTVTLDASKSFDKDKDDKLLYTWDVLLQGKQIFQSVSRTPQRQVQFDKPGAYDVVLIVADSHGATSTAKVHVAVGNAPPTVRFLAPAHGGFFDWGQPIEYRVAAEDEEDGSTAAGTIPHDRVSVQASYRLRREGDGGEPHPGLTLMKKTTCFACHAAGDQSKGPPYALVAQKYQKDASARERLASKVITGGAGAWGAYPMPPHPQHTLEQTRLMVDWIMTLTAGHEVPPTPGTEGAFTALAQPEPVSDHGVYVITARYTDNGASGVPPLTGEATCVLHARRKKPAFAELRHGVEVVHELEGKEPIYTGMVARFSADGYVRFDQMNLAGIERVDVMAGSAEGARGDFALHADSPTGPLVAQVSVDERPGYRLVASTVKDPGGVHDLYVVAQGRSGGKGALSLLWLEFHDSTAAAAARKLANAEAARRMQARAKLFKGRPFVKDWKMDDLTASLGGLERGRSFERGKGLFVAASCASCHKLGKEGGTLGPDLTEVSKRLAKQPMPRVALLREVLEPSAVIEEKYRTHIVVLDDGTQKAGIIVEQDGNGVRIAANPAAPDERVLIPRDRIEAVQKSNVSMMPVGLVSSLTREEILDLLAYVEAGGDPQAPAFRK